MPEVQASSTTEGFFRSVVITIVTKVFLVVLKLGTSVITSRVLGPTGRGLFYSSVQTAGLCTTAGALSAGEGIIYRIGRKGIDRNELFFVVVVLSGILSLFVSILLLLILPLLRKSVFSDFPEEVFLAIHILIPTMVVDYLALSALKGIKKFVAANKLSVVTRTNLLLFLVISIFTIGTELTTLLQAYVLASVLNSLILLYAIFYFSGYKIIPPKNQFGKIIKFGIASHIGTFLAEVEYRSDTFILLYFLNPSAVGIYTLGVTLAQILWYISNSINTVLFPFLSGKGNSNTDAFTALVTKHTLYVNFFLSALIALFGSLIVTFLYGIEYKESYLVFLLLWPGLLFDTVSRSLAAWLKGTGKPLRLSFVSGFSLILNVTLNILIIPRYGFFGAAAVSSVSYAARALTLVYLFNEETKISPKVFLVYSRKELADTRDALFNLLKRR